MQVGTTKDQGLYNKPLGGHQPPEPNTIRHRTSQINFIGTDMNPFRTIYSVQPYVATFHLLHLVITNDFCL